MKIVLKAVMSMASFSCWWCGKSFRDSLSRDLHAAYCDKAAVSGSSDRP